MLIYMHTCILISPVTPVYICLPCFRCAAAHAAACAARAAGADGLSIVISALDILEEDWTFDAGAFILKNSAAISFS
jgi:hypothetical protein